MSYTIVSKNELAHYGIKGQKWGVRRFQNPDGTLTAEGKERYRKGNLESTGSQKSVTAIAVVAGVYALPLAVLGIATVADKAMEKKADKQREQAEDRVKNAPKDKKTKMPLKTTEATYKEDMKNVNPGMYHSRADTQNNCGYCTITYDLRRKGFDVIAPLDAKGTDSKNTYSRYYTNAKVVEVSKKAEYSDILSKYRDPVSLTTDRHYKDYQKSLMATAKANLLKQPEGSRGFIGVGWSGSYGGHSLAYEIRKGQVWILDTQVNAEYKLETLTDRIRYLDYARLDNATPNYENIRKDWGIK